MNLVLFLTHKQRRQYTLINSIYGALLSHGTFHPTSLLVCLSSQSSLIFFFISSSVTLKLQFSLLVTVQCFITKIIRALSSARSTTLSTTLVQLISAPLFYQPTIISVRWTVYHHIITESWVKVMRTKCQLKWTHFHNSMKDIQVDVFPVMF